MSAILDRIESLRHGRAHHTWLGACGVARNTIKAIKDGVADPSDKVLTNIARCENASYTWLTEGEGSPYRVATFESDFGCALALSEYLADEAWTVYEVVSTSMDMDSDNDRIFTDNQQNGVIILTLPANFQRSHGGYVEYMAVEILTNAGLDTFGEAAINASVLKKILVDDETLEAIKKGDVGTFALLGDSKHDGLLTNAEIVSMADRLNLYDPMSQKKTNQETIELTADEQKLLAHYRALSDDNKNLVMATAKNLK